MSRPLTSHPGLKVGECVPFYFWPRSVMLYLIDRANHPALAYRGGQAAIVHLVADLRKTARWADDNGLRWAFTLSNAGATYFDDRRSLDDLGEIDWSAVKALDWRDPVVKEHKQAEFLVEKRFAWQMVSRIGVMTEAMRAQVAGALRESEHRPRVDVKRDWYLLGRREKEGTMIEFKVGDILAEDVEALVNTVNCVGVMGRGVALQFKRAFPTNFKAYAERCKSHEMRPGEVFVFETASLGNPRYIINFPTKRHWRGKSRPEDIESGLKSLIRAIEERAIRSIALPPLASGLGGLDWAQEVRPMLAASLSELTDVRVVVFEPGGGPEDQRANRSTDVPEMTPARAALVVLMDRYIQVLLDPYITLLEVHKLMYFMQEAGEPLKLRFVKGHYGPYAENLRHLLNAVEGHFVAGYLDGGDAPSKPLDLVPGAVDDARAVLASADGTRQRIERVRRLVEGFETGYGMELLATVHWVVDREQPRSFAHLAQLVGDWALRKRRFTERQLRIAADKLHETGWIDGTNFAVQKSVRTINECKRSRADDGKPPKQVPTGPILLFRRILTTWRLSESHAICLLGLDPSDTSYMADVLTGREPLKGRDANDRLAYLIQMRMSLFAWLGDEAVENDWLRETHATLDGQVPMDLLLEGSMENLLLVKEYVEAATGW